MEQESKDPEAGLSRIRNLHIQAGEAILRARFLQSNMMPPDKFVAHCLKCKIGEQIGLSVRGGYPVLEQLHKMQLIVPLLISPKGTDEEIPMGMDQYSEWSSFGSQEDEGGFVQVFYHPFQVLLVSYVETEAQLMRLDLDALRKLSFKDPELLDCLTRTAGLQIAYLKELVISPRFQKFYGVFPMLVLADQVCGPQLRGNFRHFSAKRPRSRGRHDVERQYDTWNRWQGLVGKRLPKLLAENKQTIQAFAENMWFHANHDDPLRGWNDLVAFIPWKERERLQNSALWSHRKKEIALLLASLLVRAFGGNMYDYVDPSGLKYRHRDLGRPLRRSDLTQLELVANRYELNPTANVVWFIEGHSEYAAIKAICGREIDFIAECGVRMLNVRGAGNINNIESAIVTSQAIGSECFVLADKGDKGVVESIDRLIDKKLLKRENVLYSEPSFELANFHHDEIAETMNEFFVKFGIGDHTLVTGENVAAAKRWERAFCGAITRCGKTDTCNYECRRVRDCEFVSNSSQKVRFTFSKPEFAVRLAEKFVFPEIDSDKSKAPRPIVEQLNQVFEAAFRKRKGRPSYFTGESRPCP